MYDMVISMERGPQTTIDAQYALHALEACIHAIGTHGEYSASVFLMYLSEHAEGHDIRSLATDASLVAAHDYEGEFTNKEGLLAALSKIKEKVGTS